MREQKLWVTFICLLAFLPLFQSFTNSTGKFQSIQEAGYLLKSYQYAKNSQIRKPSALNVKFTEVKPQPTAVSFTFGNLLAMHNVYLPDATLAMWQQEAVAQNTAPGEFYGTLFKTISPNVFFNIRACILLLSVLNLLLIYLLLSNFTKRSIAAGITAALAWLPPVSALSAHISSAPILLFLFLLGSNFLFFWKNSRQSDTKLHHFLTGIAALGLLGLAFFSLWQNF